LTVSLAFKYIRNLRNYKRPSVISSVIDFTQG
jgi:hypothetical protein